MKAAVSIALLVASVTAANAQSVTPKKPVRVAAMCFFQYEQPAGMNKICYYDCLGSPAAITISAVSLCPLSISR